MKKVTLWTNVIAVGALWVLVAYSLLTLRNGPPAWFMVAVGVGASIIAVLVLSGIIRAAFYLVVAFQVRNDAGQAFDREDRGTAKWTGIAFIYAVVAFLVSIRIPEPASSFLVVSAGAVMLFVVALTLHLIGRVNAAISRSAKQVQQDAKAG